MTALCEQMCILSGCRVLDVGFQAPSLVRGVPCKVFCREAFPTVSEAARASDPGIPRSSRSSLVGLAILSLASCRSEVSPALLMKWGIFKPPGNGNYRMGESDMAPVRPDSEASREDGDDKSCPANSGCATLPSLKLNVAHSSGPDTSTGSQVEIWSA